MTQAFPDREFDRPTIVARNAQRSSIGARKKTLITNFRVAVRALNQEQTLLDELQETDDNVLLLLTEKKITRKLVDPKGARAEISARRWECKQSRLQTEVDQVVEDQRSLWVPMGERKRLKRNNRFVDDEAEEALPGEEDEAEPAFDE